MPKMTSILILNIQLTLNKEYHWQKCSLNYLLLTLVSILWYFLHLFNFFIKRLLSWKYWAHLLPIDSHLLIIYLLFYCILPKVFIKFFHLTLKVKTWWVIKPTQIKSVKIFFLLKLYWLLWKHHSEGLVSLVYSCLRDESYVFFWNFPLICIVQQEYFLFFLLKNKLLL